MLHLSNYSIVELFRLSLNFLYTKLFYRNSRLIRHPFYCRGNRFINFGKSLTVGVGCRIEALKIIEVIPSIVFGNRVQLNDYVHICALNQITIGDDVLIASHVYISDNSHGSYKGDENDSNPQIPPILRDYPTAPVSIGDCVWIGEGVMILPGVKIGNGVVIGAHSIINKNIPDNCIVVGSPAKIVKRYNPSIKRWEKTNPDGSFIQL